MSTSTSSPSSSLDPFLKKIYLMRNGCDNLKTAHILRKNDLSFLAALIEGLASLADVYATRRKEEEEMKEKEKEKMKVKEEKEKKVEEKEEEKEEMEEVQVFFDLLEVYSQSFSKLNDAKGSSSPLLSPYLSLSLLSSFSFPFSFLFLLPFQ